MTEIVGNTPFLSIITVSRNNLRGLERTYASIQEQSSQNFEWIVIDGKSTDNTLNFLEESEIDCISEPDNGIYDAMNKGIERVRGQYVLFLNAGDTLADSNVINTLHNTATIKPDFIYGDSIELNAYKKARKPSAKYGMFTHHQSMIYKAEKLSAMRYNCAYEIAADYELTARFLKFHTKVAYLPAPICEFEAGGISQQKATQGRMEQFKIRKNLGLCSSAENAFITAIQACLWTMRSHLPAVYWRLKSSGNNAPATSQI